MKKLFAIFAVLVLAGILFSCHSEPAEGNPFIRDFGQLVDVYSSSSDSGGFSLVSSSSYILSSSSLLSSSSDMVLCVIGLSCIPIDRETCLQYGDEVEVCPSSSSHSNEGGSSSSALVLSMVLCVIGSSCVDMDRETCLRYGNEVDVCPVSSSSSLSLSFSSSIFAISSSSSNVVFVECPSYNSNTHFCDSRDYKVYKKVEIGSQVWMAENLNYDASGSKCYNNQDPYCVTYGRLYGWATAMELPASCGSISCASQINAKHRGICPAGWHIPNSSDWDILMNYVQTDNGSAYYNSGDNAFIAGKYLKATSGWNNGNGEDKYGFTALPGGRGYSGGSFYDAGGRGCWWSASESYVSRAYYRGMDYDVEYAYWIEYDKSYLFSVRCLQD